MGTIIAEVVLIFGIGLGIVAEAAVLSIYTVAAFIGIVGRQWRHKIPNEKD